MAIWQALLEVINLQAESRCPSAMPHNYSAFTLWINLIPKSKIFVSAKSECRTSQPSARSRRQQGCGASGGASGLKVLALAIETTVVVTEYIWVRLRTPSINSCSKVCWGRWSCEETRQVDNATGRRNEFLIDLLSPLSRGERTDAPRCVY